MKKYLVPAVLALSISLFSTAAAFAQTAFEGTVTLSMITPADSNNVEATINIKGEKMEIDIDAGVQGMIKLFPDAKKHTMAVAMMAMKMGQEMPLPTGKDAAIDLKPLGKKDVVAGLSAEAYSLSIPEADFVIWATPDMAPNLRSAYEAAIPHIMQEDKSMTAAVHQLGEKNLVPIKIEISPKGAPDQNAVIAFVKTDAKHLDDKVFEIPKDVKMKSPGAPGAGDPSGGGGAAH